MVHSRNCPSIPEIPHGILSANKFIVITNDNLDKIMKKVVWSNILLTAALSVFAASAFGDDMSTNQPTTMPTLTPADFAWDASLVNLKEVRLGEAAQTNSQNAAVQEFGRHMVRDHARMNARLAKIASSEGLALPDTNTFYIPVTPPETKPATELMQQTPQEKLQLAQLDVQHLLSLTGTEFDHAYADAMVNGHAKVIQKFQDASSSLQDEQLKKYADRSLRTVRDHYEMAQKLQSEVMTNAPAGTMTNSMPGSM
jgi:putative membrane protein